MVNEKYSIAIAETLHYLNGIRNSDIEKIPRKFMTFLNDNASNDYICNFDYTKPLRELDISDEARGLIAMICLNYWCITAEEKEKFKSHLAENEKKYQEELREKYNPDNIFKNKEEQSHAEDTAIEKECTEMIEYKEQNWFQKVFAKILNIFNK